MIELNRILNKARELENKPFNAFINVDSVEINPYIAEYLLDVNYEHNRSVYENHVNEMVEDIKRNSFFKHETIHFTVDQLGGLTLVDGQHRLNAVLKAGKSITQDIRLIKISNEKEKRDIYNAYNRDKVRSNRDRTKWQEELLGITESQANKLRMAVNTIGSNFGLNNNKLSLDQIAYYRQKFLSEANTFIGIQKQSEKNIIKNMDRTQVWAMALLMLRHQPEKATEFWLGVADPYRMGRNERDPRRVLHEWLKDKDNSVRSKPKQFEPILLAWDYFFKNKDFKGTRINLNLKDHIKIINERKLIGCCSLQWVPDENETLLE